MHIWPKFCPTLILLVVNIDDLAKRSNFTVQITHVIIITQNAVRNLGEVLYVLSFKIIKDR